VHIQPLQPLQTTVHMGCTRACERVKQKLLVIAREIEAGKNHEHAQIFASSVYLQHLTNPWCVLVVCARAMCVRVCA
jgi:hypothetical protein